MLNVNIFGSYEYANLPNIPVASVTEEDIYGALQDFAAKAATLAPDTTEEG